jgi:hypothetical protein
VTESGFENDALHNSSSTESDAPSIESQVAHSAVIQTPTPSRGKKMVRTLIFVIIIGLAAGGYFLIQHTKTVGGTAQTQGRTALSETELRDLVVAKHLTVFWAGPMAGAKYTLTVATPGIVYLKYLPGGVGLNDTKTLYRVVGTYAQKSAFTVARNAAAAPGSVGFLNADGNAVVYTSSRPSNIYIGIKGKDFQVEVFDPTAGQALGLVLIAGQIRQIV